ncbi:transketolase [Geothermobacter hydrogeniphilus]|uniref:Transketolase n=1 Tax=Geothermobacter hydrogeniphilus TaxID=1969733 RepID=A0A1X0XPF1_9BACT|nr:transketolase [Geothermobacter hydrogeniphilus]ORJ54761.1 transketolase [Geothermobacter hydrogeniphilus]
MTSTPLNLDLARPAVDTIRLLAADMVEKANSGHPGTPMEAAPIAYLLFARHMRYNPKNPDWAGRDRFILSCGHASALLYSMLHLTGYELSLEDLKNFRQLGSPTAGHPEFGHAPGIETTTGPLGQGISVGVGMAMGQRFLQKKVSDKLFDSTIYGLCSDGDLMEGVASEAASLAGTLRLGNLVYLYLDNKITIEGDTQLAFTEEVATRYLSYGWQVQHVEGENLKDLDQAIARAKHSPRPSLIIARSHIGFGAPTKQDTAGAHGAPLGSEELAGAKTFFGRKPEESFVIPSEVKKHMEEAVARGAEQEAAWQTSFETELKNNEALQAWQRAAAGELPEGWDELPVFAAGEKLATRQASGKALNALAQKLPFLLGGSADLGPSNNTTLQGEDSFTACTVGRNIHFGVREHAMGSILNGLAHTPGLIPFGGTFAIFADYMRPPMRLAAMMGLRTIYVLTHDSIGLGEDGPTHQPIEQLANLRAVPNLTVIRPGDANETVEAWKAAIANTKGPTALILSRQGWETFDRDKLAPAAELHKGGYVLSAEQGELQAIIIATGSELPLAMQAQAELQAEGIGVRVVSLPSWELFEQQGQDYIDQVLPPACACRVAVEAGSTFGWERYVGRGKVVGMTGFGASGPAGELFKHFGITAEKVAAAVREQL